MKPTGPTRIGELLIHLGLLTENDLIEASHVAVDLGLPLGRALVMSDYITEPQLKAIIQAQSMIRERQVDIETVGVAMKVVRDLECGWEEALIQCGFIPDPNANRTLFGELLVEAEILTQEDVANALKEADETNMPMGRILSRAGKLSPLVLNACLNAQLLLRDGRITRAQAVNALWAAYAKQITIEEELQQQGIYQPPPAPRMRLGELLVLSGLMDEQAVLDALELCLTKQKMIGEVLLEQDFVQPEVLEAALQVQHAMESQNLPTPAAAEALRRVKDRQIPVQLALAEMGMLRSSHADRLRIGELLTAAGVISADELQDAIRLSLSNNALFGKMLLLLDALDVLTLHSALRCQFMMREGLLGESEAIALLKKCWRENLTPDAALAETNALSEPEQTSSPVN